MSFKENAKIGLDAIKKFWEYIWNDDSLLSWVLNIIVAIVLIKFLIYPVLGFILSSPYPIVAVVSGSMEHDGSFDDWWGSQAQYEGNRITQELYYDKYGISKEEFKKFSFKNGFNTGDIMILYGTKPKDLKIGDIIVFHSPARPDPIIHRVINKWEVNGKYHFTTKGDHNQYVGSGIREEDITEDRVIARAVFKIPYVGWVKIAAYKVYVYVISIMK